MKRPSVAVVISAWEGTSDNLLRRLLLSMKNFNSGLAYDLVLTINGAKYSVPDDLAGDFCHILQRENIGFNLGAWDYAWRRLPQYDHFMFIQDDCFVRFDNWLIKFLQCFEQKKDCGLVGEYLNPGWNHTWGRLLGTVPSQRAVSGQKRQRAEMYLRLLQQWGIPPGDSAAHLTSVVHFTSRKILEEVDGYPVKNTYQQAVAAEIAFSRKIVARGYCLRQVARWRHSFIGHPQWPQESRWKKIKAVLRNKTCREVP